MKNFLLAFGFVLSVCTMGFSTEGESSKEPAGFLFKSISVNGETYDYAVYLPRNFAQQESWPLILFLHGRGESGTDGIRPIGQGIGTAILRNPDRWPFVVIFPQKPDRDKQWEDYEEAVMAMFQKTENEYRTDPSRRYLTGLSQGGHGTMVLGARHADLWAAIVPICGYSNPAPLAEKLTTMPIWCFHGDADRVIPLERSEEFVEAVRSAGGSAKLTVYPDVGHNSWDLAYGEEELPRWLLSKTREPGPKE